MNDPMRGFEGAREKLIAGAPLNLTERNTLIRGIESAVQHNNVSGAMASALNPLGGARTDARDLAARLATQDAGRQANPFQNESLRVAYDRQLAYDRYVADRELTWKRLTDNLTPGRAEQELEERVRSIKQLAANPVLDEAGMQAKALRSFRERTGPGLAWDQAERDHKQLVASIREAKRELADWEKSHPIQAKVPSRERQALATGLERQQTALASAESTIKAGQKEWGKVGAQAIAEERGYQQQISEAKRMQQHIAPLRDHAVKHAKRLDNDLTRPTGRDLTRGLNR
ncbi:hypothetical protein [Xanthomonas theicola]|nr:hypothetical protein [Xanthomonas theicola]QNH27231.1 hypothetical protein G4Q83_22455 [Xanthomonas theicola]